jgi:hypothetical protein
VRTWFKTGKKGLRQRTACRHTTLRVEPLESRSLLNAGYAATNLLSDIPGLAAHTATNFVNPWGLAETPQGQFRASANVLTDSAGGVMAITEPRGRFVPLFTDRDTAEQFIEDRPLPDHTPCHVSTREILRDVLTSAGRAAPGRTALMRRPRRHGKTCASSTRSHHGVTGGHPTPD